MKKEEGNIKGENNILIENDKIINEKNRILNEDEINISNNKKDIIDFKEDEKEEDKIKIKNLDENQNNNNNYILEDYEKTEFNINGGIIDKNKNNNNNNNENNIDNINKNHKKALHYCEVLYYDNNNIIDIYHLILANEDSEAGKFYNKYTYSFIENRYNDYTDIKSFDILEEVKNVFKDIAPLILSKKIDDITFNDNEDIINNKLIQLKSKEELVLNDCYIDEGNSFYKINGFQPKYNYFKPDDKTLEIRLEMPGNCSCKAKKSVVKDKVIITFYGIKKPDKSPKNPEDNLFNSRDFTNFEFNVILPIEEFEISSNVKEGYPQKKNGIYIFQFELATKVVEEISIDVDDEV